jgi:hypothetical protein
MGRPPARRRCFVCGIRPDNSAGVFVGACTIAQGQYVRPADGAKSRYMRAASLSVGLCAACLDDAQRDGRVYASRNLRATLRPASADLPSQPVSR